MAEVGPVKLGHEAQSAGRSVENAHAATGKQLGLPAHVCALQPYDPLGEQDGKAGFAQEFGGFFVARGAVLVMRPGEVITLLIGQEEVKVGGGAAAARGLGTGGRVTPDRWKNGP